MKLENEIRVVYVLHSTDIYAGSSKSFLVMLKGLLERGVKPLVVLPDKGALYYHLLKSGIQADAIKFRPSVYPNLNSIKNLLLFMPKLLWYRYLNAIAERKLITLLRDYAADIVHTNTSVIDIGEKAAFRLRIPHIWHIREYGDKDFSLRYFPSKKNYLRRMRCRSYAICITKDIKSYFCLSDTKAKVIYNGIMSEREAVFTPIKERFFLYAGRIEYCKGLHNLLWAYAGFRKRYACGDFKLLIAGGSVDRFYRSYIDSEINRLALNASVEFLGERKDIAELMSKAYLVIVPSMNEAFGRVTAEAMFAGALVIGRDTAGTKEQFDNGLDITGSEIGLRYSTQEELENLMCKVALDGVECYFPRVKASQKTVTELYTIEVNVAKVYDFYMQIIR